MISYLGRVYAIIEDGEITTKSLSADQSRWEDAYWAAFVIKPATPARFLQWWIARRWIIPRDPSKEVRP